MEKNNTAYCPVCGSDKLRTLYMVDSRLACKYFIHNDISRIKLLQTKIEKLWSGKASSYLACEICTFEFAWPFISADADIYSLIYYTDTIYPAIKWEYVVSFESIDNYLKTISGPVSLIEIGAGNGSFIKEIQARQPGISPIYATEYSEAGVKAIESLDIQCFRKDFIDLDKYEIPGTINLICLFQVLEHMTSIHEFFKHLNKLTTPGARLYISVPNYLQRRFFDRLGYFYDLPPVHVGRYNPKCLAELSDQYGWHLIEHRIQPTKYRQRVKKFLFAQFARRQGTFATEKLNLKILKLFLRYSIYLLIAAIHIRVILGLRKSNLGTAQWFALEKTN
jgi:SAM-dependent methyltransferase